MSLLSLPIELQQKIIEDTLPNGFESLALTCKVIYHSSEYLLSKHNKLRRRWKRFAFQILTEGPTAEVEDRIASSIQLLQRIGEEPIIAQYIEYADLKFDASYDSDRDLRRHIWNLPDLEKLVNQSNYLADTNLDPSEWLEDMVGSGNTDRSPLYASVLLLTLLPNVRVLSLPESWSHFPAPDNIQRKDLWALLDRIQQKATGSRNTFASLSNLTTINPSTGMGYENRHSLQTFTPFLALDSLRTFRAGSCIALDDNYTGIPFEPRYDSFGSNLDLKFGQQTKWHGCGHHWDAGAFTAAIEQECCDTLEELSLSIVNGWTEIITGVVSMTRFKRLKHLELDIKLLLGPPYAGLPDQSESGFDVPMDNPKVPRLVDLLPLSIARVELLANMLEENIDCLSRLFDDFASMKNKRLPNLSLVTIRCGTEGSRHGTSEFPELDLDSPTWKHIQKQLDSVKGNVIQQEGWVLADFMETFRDRFGVQDY